MTFSFRFDEASWWAFVEHHYRHSPMHRRFRVLACAIPALVFLLWILYRMVQGVDTVRSVIIPRGTRHNLERGTLLFGVRYHLARARPLW